MLLNRRENTIFVLSADVNEERGCSPQHLINLGLRYAEARIDYMGTCILMGNLSAFKTDLRDEWKLQETTSPSTGELRQDGGTNRYRKRKNEQTNEYKIERTNR